MYQAFVDAFSLLAQLDSAIIRIVLTSIQVSLTALILGTLIGLPLGAWLATEEFAGKKVAIVILNSLMGVPTVIVGVLVYLILSRSDGLVHLSDLSWNEPGEEAVKAFKKGDELEAVVLAIDVEKERISLGIKQMSGDPFNNYTSTSDKGSLVSGTVKSVDAKGAVIHLADEVEGYLRASEISTDRVEDARNALKEGDTVSAMIINIDRKSRAINLSIKAKDSADQQDTMNKLQSDAGSGTTNLGALLKAKMDNQS